MAESNWRAIARERNRAAGLGPVTDEGVLLKVAGILLRARKRRLREGREAA